MSTDLPMASPADFRRLLGVVFEEIPDSLGKWAAALAVGTPNCIGRSVGDMASLARCSESKLIHRAVEIASSLGFKGSPFLRSAVIARVGSGEVVVKN